MPLYVRQYVCMYVFTLSASVSEIIAFYICTLQQKHLHNVKVPTNQCEFPAGSTGPQVTHTALPVEVYIQSAVWASKEPFFVSVQGAFHPLS